MYTIIDFDQTTTNMTWKVNNKDFKLNLKENKFTDYRSIGMYHYIDTSNNDIVLIEYPIPRVGYIEHNIFYRKATQFEFDRWMVNEYPNSANSKIYNLLMTK